MQEANLRLGAVGGEATDMKNGDAAKQRGLNAGMRRRNTDPMYVRIMLPEGRQTHWGDERFSGGECAQEDK